MTKILKISEIIQNRLYFGTTDVKGLPKSNSHHLYITFDNVFIYPNIISCFGPSHLAIINKYSEIMNSIMEKTTPGRIVIQCSAIADNRKRTNSAFLIGVYAVLVHGKTPSEVVRLLNSGNQMPYLPFYDTTNLKTSRTLDLVHYYTGLLKAIQMNLFGFDRFDADEYERLAYRYGYMNWIVPDKFLAFPTPIQTKTSNGCDLYIDYFKKTNIRTVIRLSDAHYNSNHFVQCGIDHFDIYFDDCTPPHMALVEEFLSICEATQYPVAVHCKAGLGRTGTMIAAYMMKNYNFTACEAIGWIRICRPGSIIGVQQAFLEKNEKLIMEDMMHSKGYRFR